MAICATRGTFSVNINKKEKHTIVHRDLPGCEIKRVA